MAKKEWHLLYSGELTDAPGRCESFTEEVRYDGNNRWTLRFLGSDYSGTDTAEEICESHGTKSLIEWVIDNDKIFEEYSSQTNSNNGEEESECALGERGLSLKAIAQKEKADYCLKMIDRYERGVWWPKALDESDLTETERDRVMPPASVEVRDQKQYEKLRIEQFSISKIAPFEFRMVKHCRPYGIMRYNSTDEVLMQLVSFCNSNSDRESMLREKFNNHGFSDLSQLMKLGAFYAKINKCNNLIRDFKSKIEELEYTKKKLQEDLALALEKLKAECE